MSAQPLHVVMPVLTYVPGAMGGSETYVKALVKGLQERDDVDLTVLVSRRGAGALGADSEYVVSSLTGGASTVARLVALACAARADTGARALLRAADVVHYPFTVPVPLPPRGVPWVQTLHDVQHRDLPEMFSRAERAYRAVAYDAPARRATRVITMSSFCRERIHESLGVPLGRIEVAPLGVDMLRFTPSDQAREPFVFYPAAAWPHKNHAWLIEAMEQVRVHRPEMRLVLTGGRRSALGALPEWAQHRGHVPDDEMIELYRSAACVAFPSVYEGFGLPPLEAMASGCPVVAAAAGALPETCGDAAVLFDAESAEAICQAILLAVDSFPRARSLGLGHAARFPWSRCSEAHVATYRAASERRSFRDDGPTR